MQLEEDVRKMSQEKVCTIQTAMYDPISNYMFGGMYEACIKNCIIGWLLKWQLVVISLGDYNLFILVCFSCYFLL